ncbi:ribosome small subunit-dependent GTPase A [Amphibiibacter pelophylacis]|uniref:Ribosome small subunit-dependent GTPase A n=1 Tax=Amphibiibacter pelophylacis TaxID=1799477 RepID=A0ACC6P2Q4_9BURK
MAPRQPRSAGSGRPGSGKKPVAAPDASLQEGWIVASHGRHDLMRTRSGETMHAHSRGKKSETVVGDRVLWRPTGDGAVIESVQPRSNLLYRQDLWRSKSFAANVDRLWIMVAVEPVFSESQLARALIAAQSADIAADILFNKSDLPGADAAHARLQPYADMGVAVHRLSLAQQPDAAKALLEPLLAGQRVLVLGPSGTGKSTLVNLLVPQAQAVTGEISQALNSGRHTTTHTRLFVPEGASAHPQDGWPVPALLDSPGFQEFGLQHVAPDALGGLMPDIARLSPDCRFLDCRHGHEPGCAVSAAVAAGRLSPRRLALYHEILNELVQGRQMRHGAETVGPGMGG